MAPLSQTWGMAPPPPLNPPPLVRFEGAGDHDGNIRTGGKCLALKDGDGESKTEGCVAVRIVICLARLDRGDTARGGWARADGIGVAGPPGQSAALTTAPSRLDRATAPWSAESRGRVRRRPQMTAGDVRVDDKTHAHCRNPNYTVGQKSTLLLLSEYVNKTEKIGGM